jgi:hypothetical protein
MLDHAPSTTKVKTTTEAARELGLQPDQFRSLALKVGLQAKKQGRYSFWSEADVAAVRAALEIR